MAAPRLEVADIFRRAGEAYLAAQAGHLSLGQLKVVSAIRACRTAALGGHVARCDGCGHVEIAYNSCRNRHCPKCQGVYVAAVIDLFSRRVVGWSMKAEMTAQLVTDALLMAIWRRGKPDALLHHSDRGSQYSSDQFQRLMADNGVVCSMSRSGNVWDNAAMESFFSSLKTERIGKKVYRTRDDARVDVFDYIERFYNTVRRHSTIGYVSPVEFERKVGLA